MANYTDLTARFKYKQLWSSIIMQQLAGNDAYNNFAAGTVMAFFQSTPPTGWTQDVSIHDHGLRVVNGSGGGVGGTHGVTSLVAHTHSIIAGAGWPFGSSNNITMNSVIGFAPKYVSIHFASKDADSYSDLTASFPYKTKLTYQLMNQLGVNDNSNRFADGTAIPFFQAAAPTGWTKSVAHDDALIRQVNSGTGGGSGGTDSISSPPTHQHNGFSFGGAAVGNVVPTTGGDDPAVAFSPKYIDVILCTKDVHTFTDMSAAFSYKQLLTAPLMTSLAENDENNWIPATTVTPFFQATAPTGWTKSVANNDAFLRVTSGTGGGTGGADSIASPPTHTHAYNGALSVWLSGGSGATLSSDTAFRPKYADVIMCSKDA